MAATMAWLLVLGVTLQSVHAQIIAQAKCLPQFPTFVNSRGQDACLVAAYAQGACTDGQWTVPNLEAEKYYIGPTKESIDLCQCSTVVYDLISACALCQNRMFTTWSNWAANCTTDLISLGEYRVPIPPATSIPAWAYWNPQGNGDLFSTAAFLSAQGPESSAAIPTKTNAGTIIPSTSASSPPSAPFPSSTPSVLSPPPAPPNSSNVGAIVGGVVGGMFVLGLIGVLIVWLVKRKGSQAPQLGQYNGYPTMASGAIATQPGLLATPPSHPGSVPAAWSPSHPGGYSHSAIRPYNPNDPSTYYSIHPNTGHHYPGVAELHSAD